MTDTWYVDVDIQLPDPLGDHETDLLIDELDQVAGNVSRFHDRGWVGLSYCVDAENYWQAIVAANQTLESLQNLPDDLRVESFRVLDEPTRKAGERLGMIVEPEIPIRVRLDAVRNRLREVRVGDWSTHMGDTRKLAERQVLVGLLNVLDAEHERFEKGEIDLRDIPPVSLKALKILEDRLS